MPLTLSESQSINQIALFLYDFLPGKPHPYANQDISFEGVASKLGVSQYWSGGSKLPAITMLLEKTLDFKRPLFCQLILEIVRKGMIYRNSKKPITREEFIKLNNLILGVNFKIPELWDSKFLDSLPMETPKQQEVKQEKSKNLSELKKDLLELNQLQPQVRGFAFEKFLNNLFRANNLAPKSSFRLVGEQIDGSFEIGSDIYLIEAKWQKEPISHEQLLVFREKVESKSTWSRGLFISDSGFTEDGLVAFSKGRSTNIIGMTGQDIFFILDGAMTFSDAINRKARHAAETGDFYISVFELIKLV